MGLEGRSEDLKQRLVVPHTYPAPGVREEEDDVRNLAQRIWEEKKKLWVVAGPAIFTRFSTFGVSVISQAFLGHIGATELAAYALVFTVITRFATGILLGMASALETLCGQSYGAKQYHMLGVYLQRSWIVLLICTLLLLPLFLFCTPLLLLLGQDATVAEKAGPIGLWFIPAIFSYSMSFTLQMYLQSQSKNSVITYWAVTSLVLHTFLCWLLTIQFKLGVAGVMGSTNIALWIPVFGQLLFVFCGGCPETWQGLSKDALRDLWPVVKLSTSSGVMVCLELWYSSVLVLLAGYMANAEVAIDALSICINISGWELMIALGFMAATGVRVANELGAGSARSAKFAVYVVVGTSFSIGFVLFVAFLLLEEKVAYVFSNDPAVVKAVGSLSGLLAFSILLNSVQPVLSGIAIGAGWQKLIAYVNLGSYYLVGIPLGIVIGYPLKQGVEGVWLGINIGVGVQTLILIFLTVRTDWDQQVAIAHARINKWYLPKPEEYDASRAQAQVQAHTV